MSFALPNPDDPTAMVGLSYAGLILRADRDLVLARLTAARFTGWLGPQEDDWVVVVPRAADGPVAGAGRTLLDLAQALARDLSTVALAVRVDRDRVLRLDGWDGTGDDAALDPRDLGGYVSDPSQDTPDGDGGPLDPALDPFGELSGLPGGFGDGAMVFAEPQGAHHAEAYAQACSRPEVAEELFELLAEDLDPDSVIESERLDSVLRLLDLPRWLVSASSLPGDVPGGPSRTELVRLGAGHLGPGGRVAAAMTGLFRRWRP